MSASVRIYFFKLIVCLFIISLACPAFARYHFRGDANYPPYDYLDNGIPSGFNVDIARAVAKNMNLDIVIDLGPWKEVRKELSDGKIDAIIGMYESSRRDRSVDFTVPLIIISHSIFVRNDSDISSADDLPGKTVAVIDNDIMHEYALIHFKDSYIVPVNSHITAVNKVARGEVDCALLGKLQGLFGIDKEKLKNIKAVGEPMGLERFCFAVREGDNELQARLNEGLYLIKQNGEFDKIFDKWFGVYEGGTFYKKILSRAVFIFAALIILLLVFVIWSWTLNKRVKRHTDKFKHELGERRKVEKALKISEEHYRTIFNNIMDGYYYCDLDGIFQTLNPAAADILGYKSPDDLIGVNISSLYLKPEKRGKILEQINKNEYLHNVEVEAVRKDGSVVIIEVNSRLMRDPGTETVIGVSGVFRDVTKRRRMETIMMQTEKMMSLGSLATGLAHELNNPLSAIMGNAQNLKSRLLGSTVVNAKMAQECGFDVDKMHCYITKRNITEIIEAILESSIRAASVVRNMRSFSSSGSGYFSRNDIVEILESSIKLASSDYNLMKRYDFKNIEIARNYEHDLPRVYCERNEIQQAFFNIIRNAAEAVSRKEYIDDRPRFHLTVRRHGEMIEIVIGDNGPGIEEDVCKRIFEPFYTSKPVGEGIGMGLSISYFIINEKHKGTLEVKSSIGEFTRFSIMLPIMKTE